MNSADDSSPTRGPAPWVWMALAGLMTLMLGQLILPGWSHVVRPDEEIRLPDPDAYFHFRQAAYSLQHFPYLLRWDDLSFYPEVLRNDAAGLYDLTLAGLAKIVACFGVAPMRALWWVCVWFPPLCATAIMPLVYHLVRRQGTVAIGLVMALWLVLLPGLTLSHLTLGVCDHHVLEMLCGVLCTLLLQRLAEQERERPSPWWRPAWGAALPLAILQFTWLGGPLFLIIFGLAGFGQLAADVMSGAGARPMIRTGIRYWLAFLILTGGVGALFPNLIFQPYLWAMTLKGAGAVLVALVATGWFFETPRLRLLPGIRLAILIGCLGILANLLLRFSPTVQEYVWEGLGPKSVLVAENQEVTIPFYLGVTGLAGILGLLAPIAGLVAGVWRRPAWWIGVLTSLFFIALWCRTNDYGYQGALHAVLLTGYCLGAIGARLHAHGRPPWWRSVHLPLGVGTVAVVLCCWPAKWTAPLWLSNDWYEASSGLPSDGWIEAMRWLRNETPNPPPPAAHPVAGQPPRGRVGVLTDWCQGQFVNTLAGRPATSSRYPVGQGMAPFFLPSEDAVRAATLRGSTVAAAVRYVAIEPRTIGDSFVAHRETVGRKASEFYGRKTFVNAEGHTIGVPTLGPAYDTAFATRLLLEDGKGLAHFRLIFESRQQSFLRLTYYPEQRTLIPRASVVQNEGLRKLAAEYLRRGLWEEHGARAYLGHLLATVKIFEQVEGARLEGRAPPGSTVALLIPLRLRTSGRAWLYRQSCRTEMDGTFRLTIPFATEPAAGTDVEPTGPASLVLEGLPAGVGGLPSSRKEVVVIPESAVQQGTLVSWRGWLGQPPSSKEP